MPKGIYEPIGVGSGALGGGGGGGGGGGVAYYVNGSTGSDSNTGLSPSFPWKTITKVNASTFLPGEAVLFQGGQTFSGVIVSPSAGTPAAPITFGSYGGGQATISSGTSNGFSSTNQAGIIVRDLTFSGSASTNIGIHFNNTLGSNVHLQNIQVINCNVSGYGWSGIHVDGNNGYAGYDDVLIEGCTASGCCSIAQALANIGTSGIQVCSNTGYGLAVNSPSFANVIIRKSFSLNNTGATDTNWSGSGFFIGQSTSALIDDCDASGNGSAAINSTGGPIGIWAADSINVVIRTSRSINNSSGNTADGGGFGFDGGTKNGMMEGCKSSGNFGYGYFLEGYTDGFVTANDGCVILNCTTENDGGGASAASPASFVLSNSGTLTNCRIINSFALQSIANTHVVFLRGSAQNAITGKVEGNTFIVSGSQEFVDTTGAPTVTFSGNRYVSAGAFVVKWNGTTYNLLIDWMTATGQESDGQLNAIAANNFTVTGSGAQFILNDTQTNGHQWFISAAVSGTTPYVSLFDNTARSGSGVTNFASSFDNLGSLQLRSGSAFGWSSNANYADAAAMDTGISRTGADIIAFGNGAPGNATATLAAAHLTLSDTTSSSFGCLGITNNLVSTDFTNVLTALVPNLGANQHMSFNLGVANATNNLATFYYLYSGSGSTSNAFGVVFFGGSPVFQVTAAGALSLPKYTTAGVLQNDTSGNITSLAGFTGTITTAKVTPVTGANGSMTFVNGILTAQTQAT